IRMTTSSPSTFYRARKSPARSSHSTSGFGCKRLMAFEDLVGSCGSRAWIAASKIRWSRRASDRNCPSPPPAMLTFNGNEGPRADEPALFPLRHQLRRVRLGEREDLGLARQGGVGALARAFVIAQVQLLRRAHRALRADDALRLAEAVEVLRGVLVADEV